MKIITIIIIIVLAVALIFFFVTKFQGRDEPIITTETPVAFSTDAYTVFSRNYGSPFLADFGERFTPSKEEVEKGIVILEEKLRGSQEIMGLSEYKFQIIGYINEKNESILYANYFCGDISDWENEYIQVLDGGNCFFNVKANLDTGEVFDLNINGSA